MSNKHIQSEEKYKSLISAFNGVDKNRIFFYWKGRVALYAVLEAMNIKEGDEVILPGLTCVVVPNAILYLKAKPIYVDVDLNTFNATFENIENAITPRTKVIIVQNTFGLSSEVDKISEFAKNKGIYTIEDCTHGFGGTFNGKPNGSYCDAAIYSTQWNKPFSTGIGGFLILNNSVLLDAIKNVNKSLVLPGIIEKTLLQTQIFLHSRILNNHTYWNLMRIYRFLSMLGLVVGSSRNSEISGIRKSADYFKAADLVQLRAGINSLIEIDRILDLRKRNAKILTRFLAERNKNHVDPVLEDNHSFLKYPLLVNNRGSFIKNAERARIKLGDWFVSPIHPVRRDFDNWQLNVNLIPNASYLSEHLVNLPSDTDNVKGVLIFLEMNLHNIVDICENC